MPYPSQINREQIVNAAREFIQSESVETLTLSKLAGALGVKAPSLYRHVANKEALLQEVNLATLRELLAAVTVESGSYTDPNSQIIAIVQSYRRFAHDNPDLYILAMTTKPSEGRPNEDVLAQMILPMEALVSQLSGAANRLAALRGLLALVHGYVMLELNQQLQRGGDLDQTFEQVVSAYLVGWRTEGNIARKKIPKYTDHIPAQMD